MIVININGIDINFPFEPYEVQKMYMQKVIECLQDGKNGLLESPTGTGKTLSLLCSSLGWLLVKKAQMQSEMLVGAMENPLLGEQYLQNLTKALDKAAGATARQSKAILAMPKIIYASRTHSQISQAMNELKRTSYKHVKVAVLGSRDQLCIHPEISKEPNSTVKNNMCQAKVKSRTCFYYNNVESGKLEPTFTQEVLDIEDLVKAGQKFRCCPYFLSKELKQNADIAFMPYNYVLDPRTRKALGVDLQSSVLILDEAHNVEKTCEESASLQISSTDVALCITELTAVMKEMEEDTTQTDFAFETMNNLDKKDFSPEDLITLKTMLMQLESAIDEIDIKNSAEGETLPGEYITDLLAKAQLTQGNAIQVIEKIDKIILYLTTTSTSPFARKGGGLQNFNDLLHVVFNGNSLSPNYKERMKQCYKVYICNEESKNVKKDVWELKGATKKKEGKIVNYWCFSPGFGMQQLVEQGIRSIILTSGTLSPMKPLIAELGIPIQVQLENPHIINRRQVCVGILSQGPDGHPLNSSFKTRNDPKYMASLGRTIFNFCCIVPHGLLVFFPSYSIMRSCQEEWQRSGMWTKISDRKMIYVEGNTKNGFANTMTEFYEKIRDPSCKGAIFMAVCRGKVSEGLDFADANGRAVLITGLPFPPLMNPRIVLKQRYLEENRKTDKEALTGQQWYQLEASRAVNQAIGRVIRHKDDYGAIILCDCRFDNPNLMRHLSTWLQSHVKKFTNFGTVTKELREFFRSAERDLPKPKIQGGAGSYDDQTTLPPAMTATFDEARARIVKRNAPEATNAPDVVAEEWSVNEYVKRKGVIESNSTSEKTDIFASSSSSKPTLDFSNCNLNTEWNRCQLTAHSELPVAKKRKLKLVNPEFHSDTSASTSRDTLESKPEPDVQREQPKQPPIERKESMGQAYLDAVKRSLSKENYKRFMSIVRKYRDHGDFDQLVEILEMIFSKKDDLQYLFKGFRQFLKKKHIAAFDAHVKLLDRLDP